MPNKKHMVYFEGKIRERQLSLVKKQYSLAFKGKVNQITRRKHLANLILLYVRCNHAAELSKDEQDRMQKNLIADAREFGWSTSSRIMGLRLLKRVSSKVSGNIMVM